MVELKIKKLHPDVIIPSYAKPGDAGLDLTAVSVQYDALTDTYTYGTGLAVEIPAGYVGLIFPRSSIYSKKQALTNSVGVVDSGYRGEIKFKFAPRVELQDGDLAEPRHSELYNVGDRIGQLVIMPYPRVNITEVNELSESDRGVGGFGSSGS